MAIDSRDKRASVMQLQSVVTVLPVANGALTAEEDRRHLGKLYRGIVGTIIPAGFITVRGAYIAVAKAVGSISVARASGTIQA